MDATKAEKHLSWTEIWRGIKVVIRYASEYLKDFRILIAVTLLIAVLQAMVPYIWGLFIDSLAGYTSSAGSTAALLKNPIFVMGIWFGVTIFIQILEWQKTIKARKIEESIRINYRIEANNKILRLPLSFHTSHKMGETIDKIQRGSMGVYDVLTQVLLERLPPLITTIVMVAIIFSIKPLFGLIALVGISLAIAVSFFNLKKMAGLQRKMQFLYRDMLGNIADTMSNFRTIKDFTTEDHEYKKISGNFMEKVFPFWYSYFRKMRNNSLAQNMIGAGTRVIIFSLALNLIFKGELTIGQLVALSGLLSFRPILNLINIRHQLQNNIIAIEDAEAILKTPSEEYEPQNAVNIKSLNGEVEFKNITFSYDVGRPIFKDLSFFVKSGETVALVGESGVGKSTIIDLLLGYHFPNEGDILLDGIDTRRIPLKSLRGSTAVVPQEIALFNGTVLDNIKYGSFNATYEEVKTAAEKAHCTEFIEKFPNKWEQLVGERGMKLSVGQKQRIAIARAFLRNPAVLILDEPTSALDAHSEKVITSSIESLLKGRTTFIVAHRLSTVRKADKILVFKEGKIIEEGSHRELLGRKGEYAKLYELQHKSV